MTVEIIEGDALTVLAGMTTGSVQCCITSPPYFGLRDYGTGEWEGGDEGCDHRGSAQQSASSTLAGNGHGAGKPLSPALQAQAVPYADVCGKCGATRIDQQLGLEPTPDAYVAKLVEVFGEVKRVLRDDGTLWLNLGDSYASAFSCERRNVVGNGSPDPDVRRGNRLTGDLKEKDLMGIPWMVAFALRADGWYLRSEIIWAKPNPMPESVTDRPTKAHEQVFLLSKSARYFYDADAIREPQDTADRSSFLTGDEPTGRYPKRYGLLGTQGALRGRHPERLLDPAGRNKRSVWTVATAPYPDAHFATFPPKLIEPMVLAGCPREACGVCGAPWEREVEVDYENPGNRTTNGPRSVERKDIDYGTAGFAQRLERRATTTGWRATCDHDDRTGTGVVLDPFAGSGTTLQVAIANGRSAVGVELNPDYVELMRRRLVGVTPSMFDAVIG